MREIVLTLFAACALASFTNAQEPLRVFLRGGPKTHGPGQHDHPQFVEDWKQLLAERGCTVDGALRFPSAEELDATDVLVLYAAEGASIHGAERDRMMKFLGGGGGLVVLHDAICGDDPQWFKTIAGGAWEHGYSKWKEGEIGLYFLDRTHPITHGIANFDFDDEIYHDLHMDDGAHVLAGGFDSVFDVPPQTWIFERDEWRSFVSLQGHNHKSFSHLTWRALLLRGLAWAGRREVDSFLTDEELATLAYPPGGPTAPELASQSFRLHENFEIDLVAAEPMVVNPISVQWDERGRMWVACTPGYPHKREFSGVPAHDQIVILEDTDGDGRMDRRQLFYEGLDLVTSLVLHRDGVIVSAAPEILFLRDTDGDDRCDKIEPLFGGFGFSDTHAVISNLRWGVDGWIYGTQGYSGNASRHVSNGRWDFGHITNGVFRFRPDASAIEVVSSYGSNTWGLDFNDEGELFYTMANGSHLRQVVLTESQLEKSRVESVASWVHLPDHAKLFPAVVRERAAYRQIDFVGGFTAAAGCLVYGGDALPDEFAGNHFVCEPTVNLVHRDLLAPSGVHHTAKKPRHDEFLSSTDLWFRPVEISAGPDGSLYVLDFYNQAVIHNDTRGPEHGPTNAAVRPDRDRQHGRIWRIRHRSHEGVSEPRIGSSMPREALAALGEADRWKRDTAQRLLRENWQPGWQRGLLRLAEDGSRPGGRIHALWLLAQTHEGNGRLEATLAQCIVDEDPGVRRAAARLVASELLTVPADVERGLWRMVHSEDARTRLAGLTGLSKAALDAAEVGRIVELYGKLDDNWSRSAALGLLLERAALALDHTIGNDQALARELAARIARSGGPGLAQALATSIQHADHAPEGVAEVLRALDTNWGKQVELNDPAALETAGTLLAHRSLIVSRAAVPIAARLDAGGALHDDLERAGERLLLSLRDENTGYGDALDCLRSLIAMERFRVDAILEARDFLRAHVPLDVQLETIEVLATARGIEVGAVLTESAPELGKQAREAAFDLLLRRPVWTAPLLEGIESGVLRPVDLGPRHLHRLRNHPDAALAERARIVLAGLGAATEKVSDELFATYLEAARSPGDAVAGKELFTKECATCHTFNGEGADIGPNLTGMGAHGVESLLATVLDPNREVDPSFLEYVVETTDGLMHTGILAREARDSVLLRNTGGDVEVLREDIASMRTSGLSLMPAGFESLGAEGLRDIFAYFANDYPGYQVIDVSPFASASTLAGMYDPERDPGSYTFVAHGIRDVDGIPFNIDDPALAPEGENVIVLRGGPWKGWRTTTEDLPTRVEIPVGARIRGVHVLGGVAAWGHPWGNLRDQPAVRWTWNFKDGTTHEVLLNDGDVFADWIGRFDVPGSTFVEGLLTPASRGQLRRFFQPVPGELGIMLDVESIVIESLNNHLAPTFVALTLERQLKLDIWTSMKYGGGGIILGGGSSHDFQFWYEATDTWTLTETASTPRSAKYTDVPEIAVALSRGSRRHIFGFCTNQKLSGSVRASIIHHIDYCGPFFAMHAGTWHNWDWPEYYERLGGSSRSHEELREFRVELVGDEHPLTEGLPSSFIIDDELYRFELLESAPIRVLARGVSLETGASYPVLWVNETPGLRFAATTLGHDGGAHDHEAYRTLIRNAWTWLGRPADK